MPNAIYQIPGRKSASSVESAEIAKGPMHPNISRGRLKEEEAAGPDGKGPRRARPAVDCAEADNAIVPCFLPGTVIATPTGARLIEDLRAGDRVITRDNGLQEVRWTGLVELDRHNLALAPHLCPILIRAGSLGNDRPAQDMLVSPQHRVLLTGERTWQLFKEREVLVAAKHLTFLNGIDEIGVCDVTYIHFMFEQHEVVLSNGAWTESFQPDVQAMDGLGERPRAEIYALFPELATAKGMHTYAAARKALARNEARQLAL